ncbi:unnamed protein product [Allacma fusca]|uniref:Uncharacterized protein n=1 Tax=Allacma fusca TaxID=39272 RepID=A0A8J2JS69_9HEXA|nr:unnamed protein product [Allacma fusca]
MQWNILLRDIPELGVPTFTGELQEVLANGPAATLSCRMWTAVCEQTRQFYVDRYGEVGNRGDYSIICNKVVSAFPSINREIFGKKYSRFCNNKRKRQMKKAKELFQVNQEMNDSAIEPVSEQDAIMDDNAEVEPHASEEDISCEVHACNKESYSDRVSDFNERANSIHPYSNDTKSNEMQHHCDETNVRVDGSFDLRDMDAVLGLNGNEVASDGIAEGFDSWWEESFHQIIIAEEIQSFAVGSFHGQHASFCDETDIWNFDDEPNDFFYLEYVEKRRKQRRAPTNARKDLNLKKSAAIKALSVRCVNSQEVRKLFMETYDHRTAMIRTVEFSTMLDYYPSFATEEMLEVESITFFGMSNFKAMVANSKSFLAALHTFYGDKSLAKCVEDFFLTVNPLGNSITVFQSRSEYSAFTIEGSEEYMYAAIFDYEENPSRNSILEAHEFDVFVLRMFGLSFRFRSISRALLNIILLHSLFERQHYANHHISELRALEAFLTGKRSLLPADSKDYCLAVAKMFSDVETNGTISLLFDAD